MAYDKLNNEELKNIDNLLINESLILSNTEYKTEISIRTKSVVGVFITQYTHEMTQASCSLLSCMSGCGNQISKKVRR